jgi:DNA-binding NtrC family response regulator
MSNPYSAITSTGAEAAVRLLLHSRDPKLEPLLSSALNPEYTISLEADSRNFKTSTSSADVVVLDLDTNHSSLQDQLTFYDDLGDCQNPIIIMTDDLRRSTALLFRQRGAFDCIRKPPSVIELKVVLRQAYEHVAMRRELEIRRQVQSCDRLIGSSGRSQVVYDLIRRVANLNAFVLISGESGTGKELVASAIHNLGNRHPHPFVPVSCGAIPETLIEAELFGHEKGAYTGAAGSRAGYFEQAGEGTLFLDEIGELSLQTQVKLLRVLQERQFSRLGSNKLLPLNARVLFATHRNLSQLVEQGTFRRDLYFRVNVMNIHVPPLRERTEDIPALASHFLAEYAQEYKRPVRDIRPNAMELLVDYDWPGNIRELENVIQSAIVLADGDSIGINELPVHIRELAELPPAGAADGAGSSRTFDELLRDFKISLANQAIAECRGNKTLAARKLRVSRAYLHRLIRL